MMDKIFEAITTYTDEELKRFYKFLVRKKETKACVLCALGIAWLVFSVFFVLLISTDAEIAVTVVIIFFNLLIAFVLMNEYISYPSLFFKKHKNGNYFININVDTVTFYQEYIEIINEHSVTRISYYEVFKVYETKTNFYIFITDTQFAIVNKAYFSLGAPQDLHNFLCYTIKEKLKVMH